MMKKALAALLAAALLLCAVPFVSAAGNDDRWLLYYENWVWGADSVTAIFVAPAAYTRVSGAPRIETVYTEGDAENGAVTPAAEQIRFYFDGKTETHWVLKAECAIPEGYVPGYDMMFAVSSGSVLDAAGNGNARVYFDDGTEYRPAEGFIGIEVFSGLLQYDYDRAEDTVAVGDTLRVEYSGLYPVDIRLNGKTVASLPGGEMQCYTYDIAAPGALSVSVLQGGEEVSSKAFTVISSEEMYRRNLRDGLITGEDIPRTEDLIDVGVPAGSPFILVAKLVAFFNGIRIFFERLFSFTRIAD